MSSLTVRAPALPQLERITALTVAAALNGLALLIVSLPSTPALWLPPVALPVVTASLIEPPLSLPTPEPPEPAPLPPRQVAAPLPTPLPVNVPVAQSTVSETAPAVETSLGATAGDVANSIDIAIDTGSATASNRALAYRTRSDPRYPTASARGSEQGDVLLRVLVDSEGKPERVEVARSSGHPRLDRAARESVQRWTFEPVLEGGRAMPAWGLVPISFRLYRL